MLLVLMSGCGSADSTAKVNDKPLTEAEKAAIKAEDEKTNAEEQVGGRAATAS